MKTPETHLNSIEAYWNDLPLNSLLNAFETFGRHKNPLLLWNTHKFLEIVPEFWICVTLVETG